MENKPKDPKDMTPKEFAQMLSELDVYPLFASMNKYRAEERSYQDWLEDLPYELLEVYSEHNMYESKKKASQIIDQDYLATVMLLHAMETDNEPIDDKAILNKIKCFQYILCGYAINKQVEVEKGISVKIIIMKGGDWHDFLGGTVERNPDVKFVDNSGKKSLGIDKDKIKPKV